MPWAGKVSDGKARGPDGPGVSDFVQVVWALVKGSVPAFVTLPSCQQRPPGHPTTPEAQGLEAHVVLGLP